MQNNLTLNFETYLQIQVHFIVVFQCFNSKTVFLSFEDNLKTELTVKTKQVKEQLVVVDGEH